MKSFEDYDGNVLKNIQLNWIVASYFMNYVFDFHQICNSEQTGFMKIKFIVKPIGLKILGHLYHSLQQIPPSSSFK